LPVAGISNLLVLVEGISQMLHFLELDVFQPKPLHVEELPEATEWIMT
jgi:hypothetical protein